MLYLISKSNFEIMVEKSVFTFDLKNDKNSAGYQNNFIKNLSGFESIY